MSFLNKRVAKFFIVVLVIPMILLFGQSLPENVQFKDKPDHVVLIIIDGLSYQVWDRMDLPVLESMIRNGSIIERMYLPPPAHPHEGRYAKLHTCSTPNPILMSGTIFIDENTSFIQDQLYRKHTTAFVGAARSYRSINHNYHLTYQKSGPNEVSLRIGKAVFGLIKPDFMRLHFQKTGGAGRSSMRTTKNVPWRGNIWGKNSPYITKVKEVDQMIGEFVSHLQTLGVLENTTLFIMGDHGQANTGWHPPEIKESAITTLVMWGAGVKKTRIPYGEIIDVVPTICHMMDVSAPDEAQGRIIAEALINKPQSLTPVTKKIKNLNEQLFKFRRLNTSLACKLEQIPEKKSGLFYRKYNDIGNEFYDMDRFLDWKDFSTINDLLDHNSKVIQSLEEFQKKLE